MRFNKTNLSTDSRPWAFTLIELLVVIAIIGLLATINVAYLMQSKIKAKDTVRMAEIGQIRKIIEIYINSNFYAPLGPGSETVYCYKSDVPADWNALGATLGVTLPVDIENLGDYRYAFFRSDDAVNGCTASPHCAWVMTKRQENDNVIIAPIHKGGYSTTEAGAEWTGTCGGTGYSGTVEEF